MRWGWAVLLLLAAKAQGQTSPSIWLLSVPGADRDAAARQILALMGPDALEDKSNPQALHFTASRWTDALTAAQNGLRARWGSKIRFDEDTASSSSVPPKLPDIRASLNALSPDLLFGNFSKAYDNASLTGSAGAVAAGSYGRVRLIPPSPAPSPAPAKKTGPYEDDIQQIAREEGVAPDVLRAVAQAKSGFNPRQTGGGAYGLMGVSKGTFKATGLPGDIMDPLTNLRAGARILAKLLAQFDGDLSRALAAYQVGAPSVVRSGGIPRDRNVNDFLGAFRLAYRGGEAVVQPPPLKRRVKDAVQDQMGEVARRCRGSRSVACYRPLIEFAAQKAQIDPVLMEAMLMQENPGANPDEVSDAGAIGLGQLMPETARMLRVSDPTDPRQNLRGMAQHFKYLLGLYDDDAVLAVAAYNAGQGRVKTRIPRIGETVAYVRKVFGYYYDLSGTKVDYESYMPPPRRKRVR